MDDNERKKQLNLPNKKSRAGKFEHKKGKKTFFQQHSLPLDLVTFLDKNELNVRLQ
jgi:hypothetical protein